MEDTIKLEQEPLTPWQEITKPFIDLMRAPRALWAINISYMLDGFAYFGTLTYLAMYFNELVGLNDQHAAWMVGVLTSGITFSMLIFGSRVDKWGLRKTLVLSTILMLAGRAVLAFVPALGLAKGSLSSPINIAAIGGILLMVCGNGMYQPAIYAGVRKVTTAATSGMAFAMIYAVSNLGGWLPTFMSPIRKAFGLQGAIGFYAFASFIGLISLIALLTRKTLEKTLAEVAAAENKPCEASASVAQTAETVIKKDGEGFVHWIKNHPLADAKFTFFIFALIPVQTLFAYNWLIIPQYVSRAFAGSKVGENFEVASSLNALLIFILCPIVAALSAKANVYRMMILGTAVMAAPAFLLAFGPSVPGLFAFILVMSIGEAMWQPRFLQYAAEIAPEGRTGAYMGVANFPWFLTKMIVPLYSGIALSRWCPAEGPTRTGTMWLVFGCVAMTSTVMLFLAKNWVGKDFKIKA